MARQRRLGIQLACQELGKRRGLGRQSRRLFAQVAEDSLLAELIDEVYGSEIDAMPDTGPDIPSGAEAAIGDGSIAAWLEKVFQWFLDEENRKKVEELIKWIMSLFAMFGGL